MTNIDLLTKIALLDKAINRKLDIMPKEKKDIVLAKFVILLKEFNDVLDNALEDK